MILTSIRLSEILAVSTSTIIKDLEAATKISMKLESDAQARARWLLQSPRFKSWLASDHSELLLVDGNSQRSAAQKTSAMTMLSAMLAKTLTESHDDPVITLPFFCGFHTAPHDSLKGPQGILRGLLSLLLSRYDFDSCRLSDPDEVYYLKHHDVDSLCRLFKALLGQLSRQVVIFCIIDGISLFETSDFRDDLCHEIEALGSLTRDDSLKAVLKLLITSPVRSIYIGKRVPGEDRLTIPRGINAHGIALTPRRVAWQVRRNANSPEQGSFQELWEGSDNDEGSDDFCTDCSDEDST